MPIGSISPRVIALSLGVAALAGLVAGGVTLTTDGAPATAGTTATSSPSPDHTKAHKKQDGATANADVTSSATSAADKKDKTKPVKTDKKTKAPPHNGSHPATATPTTSPIEQTSSAPTPAATTPAPDPTTSEPAAPDSTSSPSSTA
jgi:hypothetical protein